MHDKIESADLDVLSSEAAALVDLWDDPSPDVQSEVQKRLKVRGRTILHALHQVHEASENERRHHAADIAHWLHIQTFMPLWAHEVQKSSIDLERTLLLLSLFEEPLLNVRKVRDKIDRMVVANPLSPSAPPSAETALTLVDHFTETLNFRFASEPSNRVALTLASAIERREGHPLVLSALFLLMSRQLSLPFSVSIRAPGRYLIFPLDARLLLFDLDDELKMTDYSEWSHRERIAGKSGRALTPTATPDRTLLLLILRELHAQSQRSGDERTANELEDLLTLAEPIQR